jgi:hypothetical protein
MRNGSSGPEPGAPASTGDDDATQTMRGGSQVIHLPPPDPAAAPTREPTEVASPHLPTQIVRHGPGLPATRTAGQPLTPDSAVPDSAVSGGARPGSQPLEVIRYGPGVPGARPAAQVGLTAEHVWRADPRGERSPGRRRLGRILGLTLTVALLAASGVVLYQRFHHAPFQVTGVAITQRVDNGCGVDVTGEVTTNGSPGTVSYQWLIEPSRQAPQVLSQSAAAGQQAVYVTIAVEGAGQGSTSQTVILQVLGPDTRTASATVTVSCQ